MKSRSFLNVPSSAMANWIDKYKKLITSSHKMQIIVADIGRLFEYAELPQSVSDDGYTIVNAVTSLDVRIRFGIDGIDGVSPVRHLCCYSNCYDNKFNQELRIVRRKKENKIWILEKF